MQLGVLITNHGKHSNEKLAIAVATDIVNIGANASGQQAMDGRKLENKIAEIMEAYFAKLADFEHGEIEAKGTAHLSSDLLAIEEIERQAAAADLVEDPDDKPAIVHLSSALAAHPEILNDAQHEIVLAIAASPFASWFTSDQIESYVSASVEKWLKVGHHMHRDWFARWGKVGHGTDLKLSDKHDPDCQHVKRWIEAS